MRNQPTRRVGMHNAATGQTYNHFMTVTFRTLDRAAQRGRMGAEKKRSRNVKKHVLLEVLMMHEGRSVDVKEVEERRRRG